MKLNKSTLSNRKHRYTKTNKIIILSVALLLLSGLNGCKPEEKNETTEDVVRDTIAVEAVTAVTQEVSRQINGSITTAGIREVFLAPKGSGTITSTPVKLGDKVSKGKTILTVESQVQKAARDQALIGVDQAQLNFDAVETLFQKGSVSEAEFIGAKSTLSSAKANLKMSSYNYNNCWLRSPFNGVVTFLDPAIERGNLINAGTPVVRIVDISKLKLKLHLGEDDIIRVTKGNRATLLVGALNKELEGEVVAVAEGADPSTGSFLVEIVIDNSDRSVKSGMTGSVTIETNETESGFIVPNSAIVTLNSQSYVYIARNGTAQRVEVEKSSLRLNQSIVNGEISAGETIIVTALSQLSTDTPVLVSLRGE